MHQYDPQEIRLITEALQRGLQARHVAVMIRAPDIDQLVEFALKLVPMIRDITGEISQLAVAFDDRAILVVAELRGAVPFGAVLGIEQAAGS